jgi:ADP-heptose:LPS heptosyltransferase
VRTVQEGVQLLEAVRYLIVPWTRGGGLDLGCGPSKAFPHFIAVRKRSDDTVDPKVQPQLWVEEWTELPRHINDGSLDFMFSWSGDRIDWTPLLQLLKINGYIVEVATDHTISVWQKIGEHQTQAVDTGTGAPPGVKTACVVRYGAIGDILQATSVLTSLKREGYHVTWMGEPIAEELLRYDPRIDRFFIQDKDQVPNSVNNAQLSDYWAAQAKRFDRFINLCETVEGTLITLPGRSLHGFPKDVRHELCNKNYLEFIAKVAEVPFVPEHRFHSSSEEDRRASDITDEAARIVNPNFVIGERWNRPYLIMWALSGSSIHKVYPHQDAVFAKIMLEIPNAVIITVGDEACRILEIGWDNEPRVMCRSGRLALRDTLALAKQMDLVIGPETGVLNAAAFESCAKIVFLSHSTHENLTKHWENTTALHSHTTPCYPCHRMHYTRQYCPAHDESQAAMCQWELLPSQVWDAVKAAYVGTHTVRSLINP